MAASELLSWAHSHSSGEAARQPSGLAFAPPWRKAHSASTGRMLDLLVLSCGCPKSQVCLSCCPCENDLLCRTRMKKLLKGSLSMAEASSMSRIPLAATDPVGYLQPP